MISANYFNGKTAQEHPVHLLIRSSGISLFGTGINKTFVAQEIRIEEPFEHAPCMLSFSDGSHCEIHAPEDKRMLLTQAGYRKSRVMQWQDKWHGALLAIALMGGILFSIQHWGVPRLAEKFSTTVPLSLEIRLGDEMLHALDHSVFEPSKFSDERIARIGQIMRSVVPDESRVPIHLELRSSKMIGPNAFALPGGNIVLTDQMVVHILGKEGGDFNPAQAAELAGVLAHEIGHLEKNHALKSLMNDSLVTVLVGSLFGDFSAVLTVAPAVLLKGEHSRAMENEADGYAMARLKQIGISPAHLADLFESLENDATNKQAATLPSWMRTVGDYVSSHPSNDERIKHFRQTAQPELQ